jgi:preprotein translocase subunit SecG
MFHVLKNYKKRIEVNQCFLQPLAPYLSVILIILAVTLITLILVQSKGSDLGGFLGGGGDMGSFRTKRGVEATLHKITIACAVAFFVFTVLTFIAWGQAAEPGDKR